MKKIKRNQLLQGLKKIVSKYYRKFSKKERVIISSAIEELSQGRKANGSARQANFNTSSINSYEHVLALVFMKEEFHPLLSQLSSDRNSIQHMMDNPKNYYYAKIKPKMKFGRPQPGDNNTIRLRHLVPSVNRLKFIQRNICNHLQKIDLPECMYGSVEGSDNILNALQHIDNTFFLTIDLKNFFTNISNRQVHQVLMQNGMSWSEARILTKLTTYKQSLPQGAPSSPILANLAFAKTALQLEEFIKKYRITFTTFLDDLTFSSTKDFKFLIPELLNIIKSNKFYPHNKKIHYREGCCEITGLIVGGGKLRLTKEMKEEAKRNYKIKSYALSVEKAAGLIT